MHKEPGISGYKAFSSSNIGIRDASLGFEFMDSWCHLCFLLESMSKLT